MSTLSDLGEFGLIDRLAQTLGPDASEHLVQGIGDDAAVYRVGEGRVHVVTTDALVEDMHFDLAFTGFEDLGFKALSVNVSDVCAMNARPRYVTVALGVPPGTAPEDLDALYRGVARACVRYGCTVVGGDVTRAPRLLLSVTVVGEAAEGDVSYRHGARDGDLLCVTGDLGAAFAGLKRLWEIKAQRAADPSFRPDLAAAPYVVGRHLAPTARLDVVEALARAGVRPTAMIDVSDGLTSEVHHLCRRSGVGARVVEAALPVHVETRAVAERFGAKASAYALSGGDDYELLFTLSEADAERVSPQGLFSFIGRIEGRAVVLQSAEGDDMPLEAGGFTHFGPSGPTA